MKMVDVAEALVDPILTAIERHRAAEIAYGAIAARLDEGEAEEAEAEAAMDDEQAAYADLLGSAPQTRSGARAALAYLGGLIEQRRFEGIARMVASVAASPALAD